MNHRRIRQIAGMVTSVALSVAAIFAAAFSATLATSTIYLLLKWAF